MFCNGIVTHCWHTSHALVPGPSPGWGQPVGVEGHVMLNSSAWPRGSGTLGFLEGSLSANSCFLGCWLRWTLFLSEYLVPGPSSSTWYECPPSWRETTVSPYSFLFPGRKCGKKKFWVKKFFGSKKILGRKKFWVKKNFGSKKIVGSKNFSLKIILSQKFLVPPLFLRHRVKYGALDWGFHSFALE